MRNRYLLALLLALAGCAGTRPPTHPRAADNYYGQASIAHNARLRWQHYGPLAHPGSKASQQLAALLFGPGGTHSADQPAVRADLLYELQAAVRLFDQERQGLLLALNEE